MTSFQALVAPFLVDSQALQRRVLESPLAVRMLNGLEKARVVGVAVLPPVAPALRDHLTPLGPEDYQGAKIGIRPGGVARAAFGALGAAAKGYVPGSLAVGRVGPRPDGDRVQRLRRGGPHGERRFLAEAVLDRDES